MALNISRLEEPIPGYRLVERLGRGGFGEVWKAEAPGGLLKAIKFVYGDLESMGEDGKPAEQELKALNRVKTIRHPYLLSLERFEVIDGQLVIVMELADRNLWDRFRECRVQGLPGIPRNELLSYMEEIAEALDLMNQEYNLQHLDIKPQNLFLVHQHIKVADFGLAKDLEGVRATITGGVTPVYAAPETFEGEVSRFCDQYSLAIVYQELLTSRRPFSGTNTRQLLMQHMTGTPDLSALPDVDQAVVARALSKKATQRYPSCSEFVRELVEGHGSGSVHLPLAGETIPAESGTPSEGRPGGPLTPSSGRLTPIRPRSGPKAPARPEGPGGLSTSRGDLPALTTPGQVFPGGSSAIEMPSVTVNRPMAGTMTRLASKVTAPPEQSGPGVLIPSLIVGVGKAGLSILQQVRRDVADRFGADVSLPHLQFLYIDTDADTISRATGGGPPAGLTQEQVFFARLNRPSYYLKREGMPAIDAWLSPHVLYRMPRTPATLGVRAFGRLALCDNYRGLVVRLQQPLEALLRGELLDQADKLTSLGLRSNRPRVYLIAGLGGGTGGGMFLDLAYIIRHGLRSMGIRYPEVIGVFPLPGVDRSTAHIRAVANSYAALTELAHYSSPGTCYEAHFDEREPPLVDAEPPFRRCLCFGHPKPEEGKPTRELTDLGAQLICQELLTPLGRQADEMRDSSHSSKGYSAPRVACAVGLQRIAWPRQRLIRIGAARLSARLVRRWTDKNTEPYKERLVNWVTEEWKHRQLDAQSIIDRLHESAVTFLRRSPEETFQAILTPLLGHGVDPKHRDADNACRVLDQIFELVGRPDPRAESRIGRLTAELTRQGHKLIREAEVKLSEFVFFFVEEPGYRIGGANAVVELVTEKVRKTLTTLEENVETQDRETQELLNRIMSEIGEVATREAVLQPRVLAMFRDYPPRRYQALVLHEVRAIYRSLLGTLPDYVRDLEVCRARLGEAGTELARRAGAAVAEAERDGPPPGTKTWAQTSDQLADAVSPDQFLEIERLCQARIRREFRSLTRLCLEGQGPLTELRAVVEDELRQFLEKELPRASAAEFFFRQFADDQAAQREIYRLFDEAAPALAPPRVLQTEGRFLVATPGESEGEQFLQLLAQTLPDDPAIPVKSRHDIVIYREAGPLPLTDLPQLGSVARDIYEAALADPSLLPHTRSDVPWRGPVPS